MPDLKLLNILKTTYRVKVDPHESRKLDLQTIRASNDPSCRTIMTLQNKTDKVDASDTNVNMLDYFSFITNKAGRQRSKQGIDQQKYIINSVIFFQKQQIIVPLTID